MIHLGSQIAPNSPQHVANPVRVSGLQADSDFHTTGLLALVYLHLDCDVARGNREVLGSPVSRVLAVSWRRIGRLYFLLVDTVVLGRLAAATIQLVVSWSLDLCWPNVAARVALCDTRRASG